MAAQGYFSGRMHHIGYIELETLRKRAIVYGDKIVHREGKGCIQCLQPKSIAVNKEESLAGFI